MSESESTRLQTDVQQLRAGYRRLQCLFLASVVAVTAMALILVFERPRPVMAAADEEGILHVRGLVIEDASKHERVRLRAPLPDPPIHAPRKKQPLPPPRPPLPAANATHL